MMLFVARFFTDLWYITAICALLFFAVDRLPDRCTRAAKRSRNG